MERTSTADSVDPPVLHGAQVASYRAIAAASGKGKVTELDGWLLYDAMLGIHSLNHALPLGRSAPKTIRRIEGWFRDRGTGHRLVLRDPLDAEAIDAATAAGYERERRQPVMARSLPVEAQPMPAEIRFEDVRDRASVERYLAVRGARGAGYPGGAEEAAFIARATELGQFHYFVAVRDDVPIATASAFATGAVVTVSNVFVAPEARREGLGAAITAHACAAHATAEIVMLEASRMGEPLYRGMGFKTCYHVVHLAPSLA